MLISELLECSFSLSLSLIFFLCWRDKSRHNWKELEFTGEITSEAGYGKGHHRNSSPCNHGDELREEAVEREGAKSQCRQRAGGHTARGGDIQIKGYVTGAESSKLNSDFSRKKIYLWLQLIRKAVCMWYCEFSLHLERVLTVSLEFSYFNKARLGGSSGSCGWIGGVCGKGWKRKEDRLRAT